MVVDPHAGATPTPIISHTILEYNRAVGRGSANGIVDTPPHNPPGDGGFKYNYRARRDYVHAHVDALVIDLEVIRSSAWGSASTARRHQRRVPRPARPSGWLTG